MGYGTIGGHGTGSGPGGTIDSISATKVIETSEKQFISASKKAQVDANTSEIASHSLRLVELETTPISGTDEKVKLNAADMAGYLVDKIDWATIQVSNGKLVVKSVDGLTIGVSDINTWLSGTSSNIQNQINSLTSSLAAVTSGMEFRGKVATHANLSSLISPKNGDLAVVLADETQDNGRSLYVYSDVLTAWDFIGEFTFFDKFIELTDTPSSYVGHNGMVVKVDEINGKLIFSFISWSELQGKPSSSVADIDDAVTKKHEHVNKTVIDKFTESAGKPLFNGQPVGGGGHEILSEGITMTERAKLDFKGMTVTDDILNSKTIVQPFATNGGVMVFEQAIGTPVTMNQNDEINVEHVQAENAKLSIEVWEKRDAVTGVAQNIGVVGSVLENVSKTEVFNNSVTLKNTNSSKLVSLFTFDESSGNALDSKGSAVVGTVVGATRVVGWNGVGNALSFDGNDYVQFNTPLIPIGKKSIRFKIQCPVKPSVVFILFENKTTSTDFGIGSSITADGKIAFDIRQGSNLLFAIQSTSSITDNILHDVLLTWDGSTNANGVKLYIDNMYTPDAVATPSGLETVAAAKNMIIGYRSVGGYYFQGLLDNLEIYNDVINPNYYDTTKPYYAVTKASIADVQKVNTFLENGTIPSATVKKYLVSFDNTSWYYSTDGTTKVLAINGLDDLQTLGMTKAQLEDFLNGYVVTDEKYLSIACDLSTTNPIVTPTITGYALNVDKKPSHEKCLVGSYNSIVAEYGVKNVTETLTVIKKLSAGTANTLVNVLTEPSM